MAWFQRVFGKCLDEDGYVAPEGEGAPATTCVCGKVTIRWSHAQPATRYLSFCHDDQQRIDWAESRGARQTSAEPIDVYLMWNDIIEFDNEAETKWYRLRAPEWCKNGALDFCVAECCSTVMCGTHPWFQDQMLWTCGQAKRTGIKPIPVWGHMWTADATPAILQRHTADHKNPSLFVFTGEKPEEASAKIQEFGTKRPKLRAKTIADYKWAEKNIKHLNLVTGEVPCGHLHQAEEDQKKKEEQALKKPANNGPLSMIMCCSRGGGQAIK